MVVSPDVQRGSIVYDRYVIDLWTDSPEEWIKIGLVSRSPPGCRDACSRLEGVRGRLPAVVSGPQSALSLPGMRDTFEPRATSARPSAAASSPDNDPAIQRAQRTRYAAAPIVRARAPD